MKLKRLVKKLSFKKVTVANLGSDVMMRVRGGAETRMPHLCTDYSYCEESCTCHLSGDPNCLDTGIQCFEDTLEETKICPETGYTAPSTFDAQC